MLSTSHTYIHHRLDLQGGEAADEEEEEEEDDEYEDAPEQTLQSETSSVAGTKRGREEDEDAGKISGDYGEFQEAEEGVAKRARHAADNATAEAEADEDEDEEEEV